MKLTVLKIQEEKSRYGDKFYYIFMKADTGQSYKTCAYPKYGNFQRCGWNKVIEQGIGSILEYQAGQLPTPINIKGLIDADISFKLLPKTEVISQP